MANIIWEGNRRELGTSYQSPLVSKNAIKIRDSEGAIEKSLPFGILPMLICMAAMVIKAYVNREVPVSYVYIIPAIVIGFILIPITMKPLLTICMVLAHMGLISPAPDYMDIVSVLMKAPEHALICDT